MLTKRIIPCLDVKNGRVVKGINFVNLRDAGDPVEAERHIQGKAPTSLFSLTSRRPVMRGRPSPIWCGGLHSGYSFPLQSAEVSGRWRI